MAQIIYDLSGNLSAVIRDDGAWIFPNGSGWADYVALNGVPKTTGSPTFPPPAPSADELALKTIIAKGGTIGAADVLPLLQAMVKTGRIQ